MPRVKPCWTLSLPFLNIDYSSLFCWFSYRLLKFCLVCFLILLHTYIPHTASTQYCGTRLACRTPTLATLPTLSLLLRLQVLQQRRERGKRGVTTATTLLVGSSGSAAHSSSPCPLIGHALAAACLIVLPKGAK